MKTSKPISTISYNSPGYLVDRLNELTNAKKPIIEFWAFIVHQPEEDGEKEHIHLYIKPSKLLQTTDLNEYFLEPDSTNPRPRGCMPFESSKWSDWYLYALHHPVYLERKLMTRKFTYTRDEVITSDPDYMEQLISSIQEESLTLNDKIVKLFHMGYTYDDMLIKGYIPIQQAFNAKLLIDALSHMTHTDRNGRPGHD